MRKPRKSYTPEYKLAILKRHLVDGVPVSAPVITSQCLDSSAHRGNNSR